MKLATWPDDPLAGWPAQEIDAVTLVRIGRF